MIFNRLAGSALALFLGVSGLGMAQGYNAPPPGHQGDAWDAPPREMQEIQRRGFHDGIEGARKDFENHRQPNVNNRDEYRHPDIPPYQRGAYREGFRRGYDRAISHLMGGPGQPPPPQYGAQPVVPARGHELQDRGYRDGADGARKDMGNNRRPDVNNRDEYRHPDLPSGLWREYREAFRRGYYDTIHKMMGPR